MVQRAGELSAVFFYFTMFLVLLFTLYLVVLPNWAAGAVGRISCFTMFLVLPFISDARPGPHRSAYAVEKVTYAYGYRLRGHARLSAINPLRAPPLPHDTQTICLTRILHTLKLWLPTSHDAY